MKCECQATALGFSNWVPFCDAANASPNGFGNVPREPGVYCIRVSCVGETEPSKIIENYHQSPLYKALLTLRESTEHFFESCGLRQGWGWGGYVEDAENRLRRIEQLTINAQGKPNCPILYLGCSKSLHRRMHELMYLEHTVNHPLWALLFSGWVLDLAFRTAQNHMEAESSLKEAYRAAHGDTLPLLMDR